MPIVKTPSGLVEAGSDFNGNVAPAFEAKVETGQDFQGNSPESTPTAAGNTFNVKMNRM